MLFRYSMSIAQQPIPIYNSAVHKNKIIIALNVANGAMRHQQVIIGVEIVMVMLYNLSTEESIFSYILTLC